MQEMAVKSDVRRRGLFVAWSVLLIERSVERRWHRN
jgi:hypothetical protein